jgi:phasin family protein
MYPFTQSVNPAVRSHIDAQIAFFNELSETMSRSFQKGLQLNMQLGQTLLAEAASTGQRMLTATGRPIDALSAGASQAQPAVDQLRAYQQQLSQLVADAQVDLSRVSERHVQETSRTARALADDVTRATVEETDKGLRRQEETTKRSREAFRQEAERAIKTGVQFQGNLQSSAHGAGGKPDGQVSPPNVSGNMQADNKIPSPLR